MVQPLENMIDDLIETVVGPFTDLMGDWFWAIMFTLLVGVVYIKTDSYGPPIAAMILIGTLMAGVLDSIVQGYFAIMAGLGVTGIIYILYKGRRKQ